MTKDEAAAQLDGNEYGSEGSQGLFVALKESGLVAVFGASDDLMEFRGAINDEVGCWNGGMAYLDGAGLLANDCENDECPHFAKLKDKAATVKAEWDVRGFSWVYETDIPHAKFVIREDGVDYCEGIVFALADAALRQGD